MVLDGMFFGCWCLFHVFILLKKQNKKKVFFFVCVLHSLKVSETGKHTSEIMKKYLWKKKEQDKK